MKKLLHYLFEESQSDGDAAEAYGDFTAVWEAIEAQERMEVNAKPLIAALKEIGVDDVTLESDPCGLIFVTTDAEDYMRVKEAVLRPDNLFALAGAGWVGYGAGDVAMSGEAPRFVIKFLPIDEIDPENAETANLEKIMRDAQEFADQTVPPISQFDREPVRESRIKGTVAKTVAAFLGEASPEDEDLVPPPTPPGYKPATLSRKERRQVATALDRAGFGGNGRFRSKAHAIQAILKVLEPFRLNLGLVTGDDLRQDRATLPLFRDSAGGDDVEIANSRLAVTFYKFDSGDHEVIAYLS